MQPRKKSRLTDEVHKWGVNRIRNQPLLQNRCSQDLHAAHSLVVSTATEQEAQQRAAMAGSILLTESHRGGSPTGHSGAPGATHAVAGGVCPQVLQLRQACSEVPACSPGVGTAWLLSLAGGAEQVNGREGESRAAPAPALQTGAAGARQGSDP